MGGSATTPYCPSLGVVVTSHSFGSAGGSAGAATGAAAGGGNIYTAKSYAFNNNLEQNINIPAATGNTTGTLSRGGGGQGGSSLFGWGGKGGDGGQAGGVGTGYGTGGGGGGGDAAGGNGRPGYVRFIYWSAE